MGEEDTLNPGIEKAFREAAFTATMRNFLLGFPRGVVGAGNTYWENIRFEFYSDGKVRCSQSVSRGRFSFELEHPVPKSLWPELKEKIGFLLVCGFEVWNEPERNEGEMNEREGNTRHK